MDVDDFSDSELIERVNEALKEDERLSSSNIVVECQDSKVVLTGCVASDEILQAIDEIMTDVVEIDNFDNQVWVDDALSFEDRDGAVDGQDFDDDGNEDGLDTEVGFDDEEEE